MSLVVLTSCETALPNLTIIALESWQKYFPQVSIVAIQTKSQHEEVMRLFGKWLSSCQIVPELSWCHVAKVALEWQQHHPLAKQILFAYSNTGLGHSSQSQYSVQDCVLQLIRLTQTFQVVCVRRCDVDADQKWTMDPIGFDVFLFSLDGLRVLQKQPEAATIALKQFVPLCMTSACAWEGWPPVFFRETKEATTSTLEDGLLQDVLPMLKNQSVNHFLLRHVKKINIPCAKSWLEDPLDSPCQSRFLNRFSGTGNTFQKTRRPWDKLMNKF